MVEYQAVRLTALVKVNCRLIIRGTNREREKELEIECYQQKHCPLAEWHTISSSLDTDPSLLVLGGHMSSNRGEPRGSGGIVCVGVTEWRGISIQCDGVAKKKGDSSTNWQRKMEGGESISLQDAGLWEKGGKGNEGGLLCRMREWGHPGDERSVLCKKQGTEGIIHCRFCSVFPASVITGSPWKEFEVFFSVWKWNPCIPQLTNISSGAAQVLFYVLLCVLCTYKLEEHVAQGMVRMGFRLQAALHGRQHLFVQLQDVLNVWKQDLCEQEWCKGSVVQEKEDVKRNSGKWRKRVNKH